MTNPTLYKTVYKIVREENGKFLSYLDHNKFGVTYCPDKFVYPYHAYAPLMAFNTLIDAFHFHPVSKSSNYQIWRAKAKISSIESKYILVSTEQLNVDSVIEDFWNGIYKDTDVCAIPDGTVLCNKIMLLEKFEPEF